MSAPPKALQQVVARALVDAEFRQALVADVRGTIAAEGYALDAATVDAIEAAAKDPSKVRSFSERFGVEVLQRAEYAC